MIWIFSIGAIGAFMACIAVWAGFDKPSRFWEGALWLMLSFNIIADIGRRFS